MQESKNSILTLIIYARCKDGFIIISDRKESSGLGSSEATKFFLSDDSSYYMSFSGDGTLPKSILNLINSDQISVTNIHLEIKSYVTDNNPLERGFVQSTSIRGFLVTKPNSQFKIEDVEILGKITNYSDNSTLLSIIGSTEGKLFAEHFLRNIPLSKMSCDKAIKYVIATMNEVSKIVTVVGGFDLGYDIVKFLDSEEALTNVRYSDSDIAKIKIDYEIKDSIDVFLKTENGDKKDG